MGDGEGEKLRITLASVADLREYFGREPVALQLPEDATLQSLLQVIDQRWGPTLPAYMWDSTQLRIPRAHPVAGRQESRPGLFDRAV